MKELFQSVDLAFNVLDHSKVRLAFLYTPLNNSHRYTSQACSPAYKAAVDNTWSQLVLLQQMGFMLWAQALEITGRPTEHAAQLYKTRTAIQVRIKEAIRLHDRLVMPGSHTSTSILGFYTMF